MHQDSKNRRSLGKQDKLLLSSLLTMRSLGLLQIVILLWPLFYYSQATNDAIALIPEFARSSHRVRLYFQA